METSRALAGTRSSEPGPAGPAARSAARLRARQPTAQSGAADDLAALYDAHAASLFRYLLALLQNAEEAEDALAELFLGLARRRGQRGIQEAQAYLFRAARNQAIQTLRKRKRRREEDVGDSWIAVEQCHGPEREIAIDIERGLGKLPAEQREVLVLKLSEGLTFREIADVVAIPANTAASRYRLALRRLREELMGGDDHA
jgi:RNA polymerase sigma-70 factor (ECF subfamily)